MPSATHILLIAPDGAERVGWRVGLEEAGYVVRCADTQAAALNERAEPPDLVLTDLAVCDLALPALRDAFGSPVSGGDAGAIVVVAPACEADHAAALLEQGATDILLRPCPAALLRARCRLHLERMQQRSSLARAQREVNALRRDVSEAGRLDELTRLLTRRTWEHALACEHQRSLRSGHSYSVVIINVDRFKRFNATCGHSVGDACLARIARVVVESCRQSDIIGRYAGEEFAVLAPETTAEAAFQLAERIRKAIWELALPFSDTDGTARVTASVGVASRSDGSWEDVLRRADDALHVAKRAGRNMVFADRGQPTNGKSGFVPTPATNALGAPSQLAASDVLVVDDDRDTRRLVSRCLERTGHRVRQACNGAAALDEVAECLPDVIIMDVLMPGMDGLECTRRLRANPQTRDVPIIMLSALAEADNVRDGLEVGADEYLTKPVQPTELAVRVRSMIRLHRERLALLRSYEARGVHMQTLARLIDFCRAVSTTTSVDDVLEAAADAAAEVASCARVSVMLPDGAEHLRVVSQRGCSGPAAGARVRLSGSVAGRVFLEGRPVVINTDKDRWPPRESYDSPYFASVPLLATPLGSPGRIVGVLNVTDRTDQRPFEPHELEYVELISQIAGATLHQLLAQRARDQASDSIMIAMARLAEHRDNDTGLHLDRVTQFCLMLARELQTQRRYAAVIDETFLHDLERAVPLHDIGKVAIPDSILLHPGRLDDEQMAIMRTHAEVGGSTLRALTKNAPEVSFLRLAAEIAHHHHERWDGRGYPGGLRGENIPLAARITAVADVYDALTSRRVYKEASSHDEAVATIVAGSGTQFDPAIIKAFLEREQDFAHLAVALADSTAAPARPTLCHLAVAP